MQTKTYKEMPSKYNGQCAHCGGEFKAGETIKWHFNQHKAFHINCSLSPDFFNKKLQQNKNPQITQRKDISDQSIKTRQAEFHLLPQLTKIFDGRFTIPYYLNGNTTKRRHVTLWITTRNEDSKFAGSRRIRPFNGRDNTRDYVDIAYVPVGEDKLIFIDEF